MMHKTLQDLAGHRMHVYYHANKACIQAKHPMFVGYDVQVPADITLSDLHKRSTCVNILAV